MLPSHLSQFGLGVCEKAVFPHEGGKSFEPISAETAKKWYYRSMLRFFRKHRGRLAWATLAGFILTEEALVMTISGAIGLVWGPSRETMLARSRRAGSFFPFVRREIELQSWIGAL